jgi:transcriptional regulator with XRE-family HTH domain
MRLSKIFKKFGVGALLVLPLKTLLSSIKNIATLNFIRTIKKEGLMATLLGEKIRVERKRLKLTLDELAEKTDSSKSYIWELENRPVVRPSAEKISKIADALGVTVEFLLDDEKLTQTKSDLDNVFFRRVSQLDTAKRAQLEKFLNAIEDDE